MGLKTPMFALRPTPNPLPCVIPSFKLVCNLVSPKLVELPEITFYIFPNCVSVNSNFFCHKQ